MWLIHILFCLSFCCTTESTPVVSCDCGNTTESTPVVSCDCGNTTESTPVVCWHGINDDADSCYGVFSTLPELGETLEDDKFFSVFQGMMEQVEAGCKMVQRNPLLQRGYHAVGLSQGGLLLRGLAQLCPNPPMRNLVTLGSPHQGIFGIPKCSNMSSCSVVRSLLSLGAYIPFVQAPAQYWHDPLREEEYSLKSQSFMVPNSKYLAVINNQKEKKDNKMKENLIGLNQFVMIEWENDTTLIPKESAHFQFYYPNDTNRIQKLSDTKLYGEDWIGLKTLYMKDKLKFLTMPGDHMDLDREWFHDNIVLKYLTDSIYS